MVLQLGTWVSNEIKYFIMQCGFSYFYDDCSTADNTTHVAAASALGSVAGTAIGKAWVYIWRNNWCALGGAGGAAVASDRRHRTESAIGGV